jgi:isohexenylglutaconyl-CoA hydratase
MTTSLPVCETLLLSVDNACLTVTFNRPETRNAMNNQMAAELNAVVDYLFTAQAIRTVVFRGADHNFCAGGDIKERRAQVAETRPGHDPVFERNVGAGRLFRKMARLPQTTIAYVEGAAVGGGFGFACLLDITLVEASAKLGMPETTLGVAPAQIAPHVVRRIGLTQARHLALTGRRINGEEALRLDIAQYLFHGEEDGERQLATLLAQIDRCGPQATAATKAIMNATLEMDADEIIEFAARRFAELNQGEEGREGQAAFVEKRPPRWPSLRPTVGQRE